ncbi:MAG TPA: hypothetical protein VF665_04150 [Longimicrobium sp.]|jgi:hypothetical protein|uniref:hypothetical protein n=1 Tax=Longimicrobium sp. TaxID=2029185 RepID=UPI002EDB7CC0
MRRFVPLLLLLAACGGPSRPRPAAAPVPPPAPAVEPAAPVPPPIVQFQSVWTRSPGLRLRGETSMTPLPWMFMRLEVLRADTTDLLVRCAVCPGAPTGWLERAAVVHYAPAPIDAARMELADFAFAVRDAASRRDIRALRPVMARTFAGTLGPVEVGMLETLAAWEREGYRSLDRMPFLMDRGITTVSTTQVWASPPEYATNPAYADLRAGFRRGPEGWEWVFLVANGR